MNRLALSLLNIDPKCFKHSKNPSCFDLLLTNFKPSFTKTNVFENGIFDLHKMISTTMKLHFTRESPKTKYYRDCRKSDTYYFSSELSGQIASTFALLKRMKSLKSYMNSVGFIQYS